ncbi:MAG: hypothetical protein JSW21_05390 [Gammaproteobacteria bacterium]|nr:MAG: hypothetical protein JSW21_05390 [Gammaproteobacteria bacterium]
MTKLFSHKDRPVHLGPHPLERLPRTARVASYPKHADRQGLAIENPDNPASLSNAMREYVNVMDRMREGAIAPNRAPIPTDPVARAEHLKAACYYLDASMAATGRVPPEAILKQPIVNHSLAEAMEKQYAAGSADNPMAEISVREGRAAWQQVMKMQAEPLNHTHALVILVEYTRDPDADEPGGSWLAGTQAQRAAVRVAEVAGVMANYLRFLGYRARMHTATASELDLDSMLLATGLGVLSGSNGSGHVEVPFLGRGFGVAVISTDMEIATDLPLAPDAAEKAKDFSWWIGSGGTHPGMNGRPFDKRPFHLGPYPMETVKRVERPTTLIDSANVPRVPKRHDMFIRAAIGDLGPKAKKELVDFRMITKSPFGHAMIPVLGGMVPLQYGEAAETVSEGYDDPKKNSQALKAALYYMGADMVGICEIPEYAWYSHDTDGSELKPYHKYAVSILVDQGYETMEGASGDDWISGAQSMRAYMRAQLIGGIVGDHVRRLGFSARGHSVMDQDVLHIPLILWSGLGELSRIGELVLNPFVGPRFKSGVITTDMPLEPDLPIDFGLQDFCNKCQKCARECPCTAIPFGDKIMFNGYEMWKPDVEKCARYRIVNQAGSMCGRCMKTCPFNIEGVLKEKPFLWMAMNLPFTRKWLADLDDKVGNGRINPVKKWWWDLDTDADGNVVQAKRVNERQLAFRDPLTPDQQKLGCYPVDTVPDPTAGPTPPERKAAMQTYLTAESPEQYRKKMARD